MPFHDVVPGDTLLALAAANGLESWQDIVNAPENASIKEKLADPGILKSGSKIFIPNKVMRHEASAVDAKHPFKISRPKAWIRMAVKDAAGVAFAGKKYELTAGDTTASGTIPPGGVIEHAVSVTTTSGTLKVWTSDTEFQTWDLKIGHMEPLDEVSGVQARLNNLGFPCGEPDGVVDDELTAAVKAFQARIGVDPTGTIDETLRTKLKSYYDPAQDETQQDVAPAEDEEEEATT